MLTLTRKELENKKKLELLEEFHPDVLVNAVHQMKTEIRKGIITQEDFDEYWPIETKSFKPVMVVENDLSKRLRLIRSQQVRWDETTIKKSIGEREGVYMDTLRNREFGIVGMPWGYDIIKGKRAVIGEIRYYGGVPYRKVSATGKANKDWQVVKDMAKKPGAKGGEKHEDKVDMPEGFNIGDIVESKNDADMPTSVRGVLGKVVGSVKGTTSVPLYLKVDTGTTVHEVNPNYMMKQSGDKKPTPTTPEKKEELKIDFSAYSSEDIARATKDFIAGGGTYDSLAKISEKSPETLKHMFEAAKKANAAEKKVDTSPLKSYSVGETLNDFRNWDWKISKIAEGVDDFNDGEVTLVNIPNSYGGNGETKKESYSLLRNDYSKNKKLSSIKPDKKDKPTKTMSPKDIAQLFKNKEDWGDMGDYVSVVDGKLQVVDSFYYGGDKKLKSLKKDWTEEGGSYAKYFKEEYGIKFKLTESDLQDFATGKYKKLFGDNMGMVLIKLEVEPVG